VSDLESSYREAKTAWPIALYQPKPKQAECHSSRAGILVASGGSQGGKTTYLIAEAIAMSSGFRPWLPPGHKDYWVLRSDGRRMAVPNVGQFACTDYPNALTKAIMPKFKALAPKGMYKIRKNTQGFPTQVIWAWGSTCNFMSYSQDWLSYESGTFDWAAFDEPPPRELFIATLRGLMALAGPVRMALTPHSEEWTLESLYGRQDGTTIEVVRLPTEDNLESAGGALTQVGYDRYRSMLTPAEQAIRLYGETNLLSGRCVPAFDAKEPWVCPDFEVPESWLRVCIIDPHEEKPDAIVWWAMDPETEKSVIYDCVMSENTRGNVGRTAATIRTMERESGGPPLRRLIDPRAARKYLRTSEKTIEDVFRECGILTEAAPGVGVGEGYKLVNAMFVLQDDGMPSCQVMEHCQQVISELKYLNWIRDKRVYSLKRKTKGPDDMVACLRYLATWGPHYDKLSNLVAQEGEQPPEWTDTDILDTNYSKGGDLTGY
jgi:hypothetical protein